jgi:hypothetical protein
MAWSFNSFLKEFNEVENVVVKKLRERDKKKQNKQNWVNTLDQLVRWSYLQKLTTQYIALNYWNDLDWILQNPCYFVHEGT